MNIDDIYSILVIIPDQLNYYCNKTDIQEYSGAV